jgi:molybdate transport repressor ModE-like protein
VIEKLRLFLVVIEEGSLRRAAERLHISQSAVTRQIQLLEHDLGGQVLERASSGVRPTIGGQALARKARGLLADYDSVMAEIRSLVRGESDRLRIGYVASAMQEYSNALRHSYASYWLARSSKEGLGELSKRMGNSEVVCKRHYLETLTRKEGAAWFKIRRSKRSAEPVLMDSAKAA